MSYADPRIVITELDEIIARNGMDDNGELHMTVGEYRSLRNGLQVTDEMVNRFLTWPLPASVCADPCASVPGAEHRSGTNLLSATEAKAMLEHALQTPPAAEHGPKA